MQWHEMNKKRQFLVFLRASIECIFIDGQRAPEGIKAGGRRRLLHHPLPAHDPDLLPHTQLTTARAAASSGCSALCGGRRLRCSNRCLLLLRPRGAQLWRFVTAIVLAP